jgi:hypothetical protein
MIEILSTDTGEDKLGEEEHNTLVNEGEMLVH